jgi:hypothetical protein
MPRLLLLDQQAGDIPTRSIKFQLKPTTYFYMFFKGRPKAYHIFIDKKRKVMYMSKVRIENSKEEKP